MNLPWRIACYVLLAVAAVFFTQRFFASIGQDMQRVAARYDTADSEAGEAEATAAAAGTNVAPVEAPAADSPTNALPAVTNQAAAATTTAPPPTATPPAQRGSRKGLFGALALFSVIGLGLMVGRDVSQYIGHRVQREIYGEASEPVGDPEYDEAERVWANGDHLDAIRLLREFLTRKPNKLHAAFRIAEIYEKDLGNNLAAALEYEEILKHHFDRQRWGWAAIHLVNLYNRLGRNEPADQLLRRIVDEYGETEAAAKARQRLGVPEPGEAAEAQPEGDPETSEEGGFKLPPGFRPK